jgi:hypothetical protein
VMKMYRAMGFDPYSFCIDSGRKESLLHRPQRRRTPKNEGAGLAGP